MKQFGDRTIEELRLERHELENKVTDLQDRLAKITSDLQRAAQNFTVINAQKQLVEVARELGELTKVQSNTDNTDEDKPGLRSAIEPSQPSRDEREKKQS